MERELIVIVNHGELRCPACGATEMHPTREDRVLIRGYKVDNYSQCLVCAGYYDKDLNVVNEDFDRSKGWFK